jgi:methyltransferase (TIGR00027 family)
MRPDRASKTAEIAAAVRAAHLIYDRPVVFRDAYALAFTSPFWRTIARSRILYGLVVKRILAVLRPVHGQILGRARYCEDQLERAIASGVCQYVIIGAGLDSFALRRPDLVDRLTVFELDSPASQKSKRRRVIEVSGNIPKNLVFVPVDFERETAAQALRKSSFNPGAAAFFSWLGTTHYLSPGAVFATLGSVAQYAAKGSQIVFDYSVHDELLCGNNRTEVDALKRFVAKHGEPIVSSFDPEKFLQDVCQVGFSLIEDLSHNELMMRYFSGRRDDLRPAAFSHVAHFRVGRSDAHDSDHLAQHASPGGMPQAVHS